MITHAARWVPVRLLVVLGVAAGLVTTSVGPAGASDQFGDVPNDHRFHAEIAWMVDQGVTTGFGDETFRPGVPVTRQAYVAFLHRLAGEPTWAGCDAGAFSDVGAGHRFCDAITWAAARGITRGYPDGTFGPGREVTRQAAAAFQYAAVGAPAHEHAAPFTDVSDDHPFHDQIAWMAGEQISNGYSDDTYRPGDVVTRQAAAAFLYRQANAGFTVEPGEAPGSPDLPATPSDAAHLPDADARDYTIDTTGAETVVIGLAACANVAVADGTVTFAVDDSGADDVAALGEVDATVSDVVADGVPHPGTGAGESITVDGGQLTFTLDGADTAECVVPVVYADLDGDGLDVQPDGQPTEDVGIGGATTFSDVSGLQVLPLWDTNPFSSDHAVTVTLLGGDVDGDGSPDPLPLVGQEIDVTVVRYDGATARDVECAFGGSLSGSTIDETTIVVDADGHAVLTYTGPADPDTTVDGDGRYDCLLVSWEGAGDYAGQGPEEATATANWADGEGVASSLDLRQPTGTPTVDTNHTLTATVTDQFGEPVAGVDVHFEIERDGDDTSYTYVRTTNADGEAALTYNGPSEPVEDTTTATALDDEGTEISGASDSVTTTWTAAG